MVLKHNYLKKILFKRGSFLDIKQSSRQLGIKTGLGLVRIVPEKEQRRRKLLFPNNQQLAEGERGLGDGHRVGGKGKEKRGENNRKRGKWVEWKLG